MVISGFCYIFGLCLLPGRVLKLSIQRAIYPIRTRREYVHMGSDRPSMASTVLIGYIARTDLRLRA